MHKKLNPNFFKIVSLLSDGEYHDGTTLGKTLNMTRSAVWKAIQKLMHYGVDVDSVKGKGYALRSPLQLLDVSYIKKNLASKIEVSVFENISSTNDYLKSKSYKKPTAPHLCLAEQQTKGKGRLGRVWHSPFAQNIYMSCLFRIQKDMSELAGLSLVTSLAILKTLKRFGLEEAKVKWPNDILCQQKKIAGTLIEVQAEAHGITQAIVGIGVNVNMVEEDAEISQTWTSLQKIKKHYFNRNEIVVTLINELMVYFKSFEQLGLAPFIEEWMQHDALMGKVIALKIADKKIQGKVMGINEQGHILIKLPEGIKAFSSGDASILKST